jgi:hypothetical protein
VPSEDYSHWPPPSAGFFGRGATDRTEQQTKKKTMKKATKSRSQEGLESRPEQLTNPIRPEIDLELRRKNRMLDTESLLSVLRAEFLRFYEVAEIIGQWVWITFPAKQPAEVTSVLSQLGFHWNNLRQAWQHPCGTLPERSVFDPRKRFGSHFAADQKAA